VSKNWGLPLTWLVALRTVQQYRGDCDDCNKFWNKIKKESSNKVTKFATCVNDVTGSVGIADMWKTHFEHLYSSVSSQHDQISFRNRISPYASDSCMSVSMDDIMNVLPRLKENKAVGPDMTDTEAYIYGSPRLLHISEFYSRGLLDTPTYLENSCSQ